MTGKEWIRMKEWKKKRPGRLLLALLAAICLLLPAGCSISKEDVEETSYYQDLLKKNKSLEKKVKKLESELEDDNNQSEDSKRANDYLARIARDCLAKLEIGFLDDMDNSEFIEEKAAFSMATLIGSRADKTSKYSPEELAAMPGTGYEYVLYDEDNAVYEIMVYPGDYVVFTDLPNDVYYSRGASALGDAFLHYREGYPNSSLLHRLADSPMVTDEQHHYYENSTAVAVANYLDKMDKKKTNRKSALKKWGDQQEAREKAGINYIFFHHGNTMTMTLYDTYVRIENMDQKAVWYKTTEENIDAVHKIFSTVLEERTAANQTEPQNKDSQEEATDESHYDEMETESR